MDRGKYPFHFHFTCTENIYIPLDAQRHSSVHTVSSQLTSNSDQERQNLTMYKTPAACNFCTTSLGGTPTAETKTLTPS